MVTLLSAAWNANWPVKVPAINPPFGKFAGITLIETVEGAVPVNVDAVSQAPPSDVLGVRAQFKVPVPALRICTVCAGTAPPVLREKLIWPGTLSKNVPPVGATVKVTGTVMDISLLEYTVKVTSPV